MILKDFLNGGFPISRTSPVLCVNDHGNVFLAYSHADLRAVLHGGNNITRCLGVWPGKKTTDCFVMDPTKYGLYSPPDLHRDIDSAVDIEVFVDRENNFIRLEYTPGPHATDRTRVVSKDQLLFDYVGKVNLRRKVVLE